MLREGPGSLPFIWLVVLRCVVEKVLENHVGELYEISFLAGENSRALIEN
jgi:hypothetical protein